jgi:Ca2+-binding EF-hand superfamily protein
MQAITSFFTLALLLTATNIFAADTSNPMGENVNSGLTHMNKRFNAADANHDGALDREEAKNMPLLTLYFDEVDFNHDGKVTLKEYFDAMPLLHGKHPVQQDKAESL